MSEHRLRLRAAPPAGLAILIGMVILAGLSAIGCGARRTDALRVVTSTSILADIARNVAGNLAQVSSVIPAAADPHGFQPTPGDLRTVAEGDLIVLNGAGLEGALADAIVSAGVGVPVIEAASGLTPRTPSPGEGDNTREPDPHFWLDPLLVVRYVRTIEHGLAAIDPEHAAGYAANAGRYIEKLRDLDRWIRTAVGGVPSARRLLVTDHFAWGYFADRYGFQLVGAVTPSVAGSGTPTARELGNLVNTIRRLHVPAVFVDASEGSALARQVAAEAGARVVDTLHFHSLTGPEGPTPTYLEMMRYDVEQIVGALR